jgi:hypothetical protein
MFNDFNPIAVAESLPLEDNSQAQDTDAARLTARNARDKHDLTELLDALGLPTDTDSITPLLQLIPDPAAPVIGTTGEDPDMSVPDQPKATPTAEEAMAVSMHYADHPMADIVEATGLPEQKIRSLVDTFEAEIDAVQMAEEGKTTAAIATATGLSEQKVTDLVAAAATGSTDTAAGTGNSIVDDATEALLAWAEQHGTTADARRAARIRTDLAELSGRRATEQATAEAEARVAEAKAALEAAQAQLRAVKNGQTHTTPAVQAPAPAVTTGGKRSREELARIRAWARENGHQVGVAGIVKKSIVEAYDAAHSPAPLAQAS